MIPFLSGFFYIIFMKLCHFSDGHLGAGESHPKRGKSGLTLRQEDIIASFVEAVDKIIEIKPDLCVYSGDLFHSVRPTNRIIAIAAEHLNRLASINKIPTVLITGNHDAPKQPHIGAAIEILRPIDNLYIAAESVLEIFTIDDTKFFALPHCLTSKILKEELAKCIPDTDYKYNILIMHGVAAGMPQFSMADLGEQEIPLDIMEKFDYTALGHFHDYSQVGKTAYYSGSTERLSQAEREAAKGFITVDFEPFSISFQEITTRKMIDLAPINAVGKRGDYLAQMIKEKIEKIDSSDKIIRLKVEGVSEETLRTMPAEIIRELKQKSYSLNISFEKETTLENANKFDRVAIGQIDKGFIKFLESVDLTGFDRERLKKEALQYLSDE